MALRESDENHKSAFDELKNNIRKEGVVAAFKRFKEVLDIWKNGVVKLAVTGKSGVGKSSFINAIRNFKSGDPGFATSSSSGNTTKQ
jgi:GTP-binding protein EngB required for normal cell division